MAAILKLSWQSGHVYLTSLGRTRNRRQGEKTATDLPSFTEAFFQAIFHFTMLNSINWELEACLAQK